MVVAASQGRLWDSFLLNPLMFLLALVIAALLLVRLILGVDLWGRLGGVGQQRVWIVAGVWLLINWAFLIFAGR